MMTALGHLDLGLEDDYPEEAQQMIADEITLFSSSFNEYFTQSQRLSESTNGLSRFLHHTRVSYNTATKERDLLYDLLKKKLDKLHECENTLQRYERADDPVVASDGFTYERRELAVYMDECKSANSVAHSRQNHEELTDRMISNRSLVELTKDLIGMIKPHQNVLPAYRSRGNIDPVAVGNSIRSWEEVNKTQMPSVSPAGNRLGDGSADARGLSGQRRFDHTSKHTGSGAHSIAGEQSGVGSAESKHGELHPCLRIYRCCNFKADCTFANYPYEACLNHIKGKCRFGSHCKELHVDRDDPRYLNPRSMNNQHAKAENAGKTNGPEIRNYSTESGQNGEAAEGK